MDKTLVLQFQRVEKALATLVASIATYNPNPTYAQELVDADSDLTHGLEELLTHQRNYLHIQSLRAASLALDTHLKSTLQTLSSTRAALLATPATTFPTPSHPIPYTELLSFASRIAKFTLPPTYREADAAPPSSLPSSVPPSAAPTNGTSTPVSGTPAPLAGITIVNGTLGEDKGAKTALPPHLAEWLDPLAQGAEFAPWPGEERIRRGALARLQVGVGEGRELEGWDPEVEAGREEEERRRGEEAERVVVEERGRVEGLERERKEAREKAMREGGAQEVQGRREEKKAYTGLDDLDDDDSD